MVKELNDGLTYIDINNVKIPVIYEISNLLPIGRISVIFYGGGSVYEKKVALSSFSADMLERGTKSKGEIKFADELESNAISLNVGSGLETLKFNLEFLKEKKDEALSALRDLLIDSNLTKEAYNQTKLNLINYILSKENDFDYIASYNLNKMIFKNTPLENSSFGEIKDINNIFLSDVKDYVKDTLTLENMVVLVGGDLDLESIKLELSNSLAFLKHGKKIEPKTYLPKIDRNSEISIVKPTKQAYIYFASPFNFSSYEADLHKAQVMSFIMGSSGFGSRIMEEIRVKRGLAYSAYFYNSINNITSNTIGYLQTKIENKDEAIKAVKETIANFIANGVSQKELDDAKAYILGSRVLSNETLSQRLNKKYINFNRGLNLNYDDILTKKIGELSLKELNSYIKSHKEVNNLGFSIVINE
ncbi:pitrilysin family protein [Helicobacter sp. MIT 14-3879]|uniref:M16 family metallopeptidase n=1 Tax=Helicobacter sp. MIT 14-3879 TaxID=2040649 RepID=UPI0015F1BFF8|nr:pitrilysin family protein [Helicobacter sp. MIT 14-3879]